jgi:signal transduction histidine kinase
LRSPAKARSVSEVVSANDVRSSVQQLALELLDDVELISALSVARMQELLPSYARVPADALFPVTLTNTRNLLEAAGDPNSDRGAAEDHFRLSGETRLVQGITADEMLQAWRIGLEVVREQAHPVAERLALPDTVLLEFVEATLEWGDVGMRRSAAAHRDGEMRELERLAAEQSALRRVATLVARATPSGDFFSSVAREVAAVLRVPGVIVQSYEADGAALTVGEAFDAGLVGAERIFCVGSRMPLDPGSLAALVFETSRPARLDDFSALPGTIGDLARAAGIGSGCAGPIVVNGALWGKMCIFSEAGTVLPIGMEYRLGDFVELVATAIANHESRSDLAESRARIVRAGDEARRRFERDLHDGAQQRLVSLGLELRSAAATVPPDRGALRSSLARVATGLNDVLDSLRELSRGLHPAVLSEDGLSPALSSLALRSAVPVDLRVDLGSERFDQPVEVAAYYVVSEALTNSAKHAGGSLVSVSGEHRDGWLELIVRDNGLGGADASKGSGLMGLVDRVEAIGGTIQIDSPVGLGTAIRVKLPVS